MTTKVKEVQLSWLIFIVACAKLEFGGNHNLLLSGLKDRKMWNDFQICWKNYCEVLILSLEEQLILPLNCLWSICSNQLVYMEKYYEEECQ